jgi:RND superfamily putative drug exporter
MLTTLGTLCARFRWIVIGVWVVGVVALFLAGRTWGGNANNGLTLAGSSSQDALDLLATDYPAAVVANANIIFHTSDGSKVTDPAVDVQIGKAIAALKQLDGVTSVVPLAAPNAVSQDGQTMAWLVLLDRPTSALEQNGKVAFDALDAAVAPLRSNSLEIEVGGTLAGSQRIETREIFTLYGLILALIVLMVVLGTWTSFAWPVIGALAGIMAGLPLLSILEAHLSVPGISVTAGVMVGLGVGIDYGLFMVGRYKDYIEEGVESHEAVGRALSTAGEAVLTAGATVIVALGALFVFQVPAVTAMAYAIVLFVVCVILTAITLVPAIMATLGPRIAQYKTPIALRIPEDETTRLGIRWARLVERRMPIAIVLGIVALLAMAIPVVNGDFRLGPLDTSLYPQNSTEYKSWKLQTDAFGAGSTNPFLVVVQIPPGDSQADSEIAALKTALGNAAGVAYVSDPRPNQAGTVSVLQVVPTTNAQSAATSDLVKRLRNETIPAAMSGSDLTVNVSGVNAVFVDLDQRIRDRLPTFIVLVVIIALVILSAVFKSVLIPIKAALLNLLVIGATYGFTVLVFTNGVGLSALGVPAEVPILSLLAPVIFAILFGLSNDYEVYLVTRVGEELDAGETTNESIALGVGRGAHIVIAAALIMVFVFASYMLQPGTSVIQFGFAMTVAIILDALLARMLLLPAILHLGGERMWWPGRR